MSEQPGSGHEEGLRLLKAGDLQGAVRRLQQAIGENPKDAAALELLGVCQARLGDKATAIASMQEALRLRPEDAAAHYNLALVLYQDQRLAEARAELEKTLALQPQHARARELMQQIPGPQSAPGQYPGSPFTQQPPFQQQSSPQSPFQQPSFQEPSFPQATAPFGQRPGDSTAPLPASPFAQPSNDPTAPLSADQTAQLSAGLPQFQGTPVPAAPETAPPLWSPAPPMPVNPGGLLAPQPVKLARQDLPSVGLRVQRGLLWGMLIGQLWFFCSVIAMMVVASAKSGAILLLALLIVILVDGFIGALIGFLIALANLDEDAGGNLGMGIGVLGWLIQLLLASSFSLWTFSIFAFVYIGRITGRSIAEKVREPILIEPE